MLAFWLSAIVAFTVLGGVCVAALCKAAGKPTPKVGEGEK